MTDTVSGPTVLLLWVGLCVAVGVGYRVDDDATLALAGRTAQMGPTLSAYVALFVLALVVESAAAGTMPALPAAAASVSALLSSIVGSWCLNDLLDRENDQQSDEERATASGPVSGRQLLVATAVLWFVSLAFGAFVGWCLVGATALMLGMNVLYSLPPIRLKTSAAGSMFAIALMGVAAVLHGSASVAVRPGPAVRRLAGLIAVLMALNLSYKDLKDAYDDASLGDSNFVAFFGRERIRRFLTVSLPVSYLGGTVVLGLATPLVLTATAVLCLAVVVLLLTTDPSEPALVYRLDMVNATYLLVLTVAYSLVYL